MMSRRKRPVQLQPSTPEGQLVYTTDEVAVLLKVKREMVQDWLKNGRLPGFRVGRHWRIRQASLMAFIEEAEAQQKKTL
jgi:excisionase family DNA binding protein